MNLSLWRAFVLLGSLLHVVDSAGFSSDARRRQNWDDHLPGTILAGQYRILEFVGAGTFGNVYKAEVISNGKFVAIKAMSVAEDATPTTKTLESVYHQEVNALRAARGVPHVVSMMTSFQAQGYGYIVMEYCGSSNLRNVMYSQLSRHPKLIETYFFTLVAVMQGLAAREIYHQDIKPMNILLADDGEIRLADFGSASLHTPRAYTRRTAKTYAAPESFTAEEPTAQQPGRAFSIPTADVWSLGIILYEMYAKALPWNEATEKDLRYARYLQEGPQVLDVKAPRLMKAVIRGALTVDVQHRWTFARILRKVREHLQGRDLTAQSHGRKAMHV